MKSVMFVVLALTSLLGAAPPAAIAGPETPAQAGKTRAQASPPAGRGGPETAPQEGGAGPSRHAYHIVAPGRAIGPGEHIELKLVPTPPPSVRVTWHLVSGPSEHAFYGGTYRAPYVIAVGAAPVEVGVGLSGPGWRDVVSIVLTLVPGVTPGAEDCLGPDQSFSATSGEIVTPGGLPDELPELVQRVEPEYPRSALARGIEDVIGVQALVCRSGRVLDAYSPPSFRSLPPTDPIEHDPRLVAAAIAAVRQYVFKPALVSGQPIATWVAVQVRFTP
jgi:hypothetical protein